MNLRHNLVLQVRNFVECDSEHFRCRNGHCIPKDWRCDGTKDCLDDSDEIGCAPVTCQQGYFKCHSDGQCIPNSWVCDQDQDCDDGSDELQHCLKLDPQVNTGVTTSETAQMELMRKTAFRDGS
ncbi:hypothetical protein P7K49_014014 [Saguinus oedipus]|uniref:Uncharacterized protein n=1 Tax=Saguinus oedipus TaxID=9490 RepID=A0ABQ9VJ11_SAGOE|nr:hypothetical protein P7K49_014014 [Saguinus oedipus]